MKLDLPTFYEHEPDLNLSLMKSGAKYNPELAAALSMTSDMSAIERLLFKVYGMLPLYSSFYKQHKKVNISGKHLLLYEHPLFTVHEQSPREYIGRVTMLRFEHLFSYLIIHAALEQPNTIHKYLFSLAQIFTQVTNRYEAGILAPIVAREPSATLGAVLDVLQRTVPLLRKLAGGDANILGMHLAHGHLHLFTKAEVSTAEIKKYGGHLSCKLARLGGYVSGRTFDGVRVYSEQGESLNPTLGQFIDPGDFGERVRIHHLKRKLAALISEN